MSLQEPPRRSRVPWALAVTVGLCSGLAGYVIHVAQTRRIPKQIVEVRRLTEMTGAAVSPAISPDSSAVAFVALLGGKRQIWILQLSGGAPRAITNDNVDHYEPRWSADSSKLIYFSAGAIWEIPVLGGDARRLVDAAVPGDLSRDGKRLAFFQLRDGAAELMIDGRTILKLAGGDVYSNLRWAPDDKKIAYLQNTNLMVADISGGEPLLAPADGAPIASFTWAPDNSGLIVSTTHGRALSGQPICNLWFLPRVEGRSPSQLTFGELSYESPDISPAGSLVVSRRGLATGADADIVLFTGLKW